MVEVWKMSPYMQVSMYLPSIYPFMFFINKLFHITYIALQLAFSLSDIRSIFSYWHTKFHLVAA